ncbi:DVUA0089 family protein [Fibrobacterota bacterium]
MKKQPYSASVSRNGTDGKVSSMKHNGLGPHQSGNRIPVLMVLAFMLFFLNSFSQGPILDVAGYDAANDELSLVFDRSVSDASFNTSGFISLSTDNGISDLIILSTPLSFHTEITGDDGIIIIELTSSEADGVESLPSVDPDLEISIGPDLVQDLGTNWNQAVDYADNFPVSYAVDTSLDSYEPDHDIVNAKQITAGVQQARSLYPAGDEDWVSFTLDSTSDVYLETSGTPGGDTEMWLYDNTLTELAYDDDNGTDTYSFIQQTELAAGTYYVTITDYGNNDVLDPYYLDLLVFTIGSGPRLTSATYYAPTDMLALQFDQPLSDVTFNGDAAIGLSTDNGVSSYVNLNTPHAWNTGGTGNDNEIFINLTTSDAAAVELLPLVEDELEVSLGPNLIQDFGQTAGNRQILYTYNLRASYSVSAPDSYEWDNNSSGAKQIAPGMQQARSISPVGDEDWMYFTLDSTADVRLETSGPSTESDTRMWLYDSSLQELDYDDDGGTDYFSSLVIPSLPQGTYYIKVNEYDNSFEIDSYYLDLTIQPAGSGPLLTSAGYNADTRELKLSFDQSLADDSFDDEAYIGLSTDSGGTTLVELYTPLTMNTGASANDGEIIIILETEQANAVETMPLAETNLEIAIGALLIENSSYTGWSQDLDFSDNMPVVFTGGVSGPPVLASAAYNPDFYLLELGFNQPVADASFNNNTLVRLSVDRGGTRTVTFSRPLSWLSGESVDDYLMYLALDPVSASSLQSWPGLDRNLRIELEEGIITDPDDTGPSRAVVFSDDFHVFYGSGPGANPALREAVYRTLTNELILHFDQPVLDASLDNYFSIGLSVDRAGPNTLFTPAPLSWDTYGTANDNFIRIYIDSLDAATMEGWPNAAEILEIEINEGMVWNLANTQSNLPLSFFDGFQVTYDEGPEPLFLAKAWYYADNNKLELSFNRPVSDASFNPNRRIALTVGDDIAAAVALNSPVSWYSEAADDRVLLIDLASVQAEIIESWPDHADFNIELEAGIITSLSDGVPNEGRSYSDNENVSYHSGGYSRDMAAYWKFDEGRGTLIGDSSPNDLNGIASGTIAWVTDVHGLTFNPGDASVTVLPDPALDITYDITLMAWVKSNTPGSDGVIVAKGDNSQLNYELLINNQGKAEFRWYNGAWNRFSSTTVITPGAWHHVAVKYQEDGNGPTFIINGANEGAVQITGSPVPMLINGKPLMIGNNVERTGSLNGSVGHVLIYREFLDDAVIQGIRGLDLPMYIGNANDTIPPAALTNFTAAALSGTGVVLAWDSIVDPGTDSIMIRFRTDGTFPVSTQDGILAWMLPANSTGASISNLAQNRTYHFSAFVSDDANNWSEAATVSVSTAVPPFLAVAIDVLSTNDNTPLLTGSVSDPAALVSVELLDSAFTAVVQGSTWAFQAPQPVPDGCYDIIARGLLISGETGTDTTENELCVDATAPAVSVDPLTTGDYTPEITGSVDDSTAVITAMVNQTSYSVIEISEGAWKIRLDSLGQGIYDVEVRAVDSLGNTGTDTTVDELVIGINDPPVFDVATSLFSATEDDLFALVLRAYDPDQGDMLTYSILDSANRPEWLNLKGDTLKGVPENRHVGSYSMVLAVSDGELYDSLAIIIEVVNVNDPPVFDETPDTLKALEDALFTYTFKVSDPDHNTDELSLALTGTDWLAVQGKEITGIPGNDQVGVRNISVIASDGDLSATLNTVLLVENVNDAPVLVETIGLESGAQQWKEDFIDSFTVVISDIDRDDEILLDSASRPDFITQVLGLISDTLYTFKFLVSPLQKDVGEHEISLVFKDREGEQTALPLTAVVEETNDMPMARIVSHKTAGGAVRVYLDVDDEDGALDETVFHYALRGNDPHTLDQQITQNNNLTDTSFLDEYPLLDGSYRFSIQAEDRHGLRQEDSTVLEFDIEGVTSMTVDSGAWTMTGIPMSVLPHDSLGANAVVYHWVDDMGNDDLYSRYMGGAGLTITRGKGYWMLAGENRIISAAYDDLLRDVFTLQLVNGGLGWNQVGNPFPYPVDMNASGLTFWSWDRESADLRDANGILEPWKAYWVEAPADTSLNIPARPYFEERPTAKKSVGYESLSNWSGRLVLRSGGLYDRENCFGVRPLGKKGLNNYSEPPKIGSHVSLFFTGKDADLGHRRYTTDFRSSINPEEEWFQFGIAGKDAGGNSAELEIQGLEQLGGNDLYTFLVNKTRAVQATGGETHYLPLTSEPRYYSIVVSSDPDFPETLKLKFRLAQNFPNPVRHTTTLEFSLPYRFDDQGKKIAAGYPVHIHLFDLKGRMVEKLFTEELPPGRHSFRWRRPNLLPSGTYLYRIKTAGRQSCKKMLLLR